MELQELKEKLNAIEGWLTMPEVGFLYNTAQHCKGRGVIVEIGSWQGKSTVCLGAGVDASKKNIEIYAVDPHQNSYVHKDFLGENISTFEKFKENIKAADVGRFIHPIVKKSEEAVRKWAKPIEFLWIDGDHHYGEVKKDFDLWSPFVIDGGIIAFHDANHGDVQRFLADYVLSSRAYKNAKLVDSIVAVVKSATPSSLDRMRSSYIVFMNFSENVLRCIPLPLGIRAWAKKGGKKFLNMLTR